MVAPLPQFYTGEVSKCEMIGLVREPNNPYDRYAIRVDNIRGDKVGQECVCLQVLGLSRANSKFFKEHKGGWQPLSTKTPGELEGEGKVM
jgi:hypothetical protein